MAGHARLFTRASWLLRPLVKRYVQQPILISAKALGVNKLVALLASGTLADVPDVAS